MVRIGISRTKNETKEKVLITTNRILIVIEEKPNIFVTWEPLPLDGVYRWFPLCTTMALLSISAAFTQVMRSTSRARAKFFGFADSFFLITKAMVRRLVWGGWPREGEQIGYRFGLIVFLSFWRKCVIFIESKNIFSSGIQ